MTRMGVRRTKMGPSEMLAFLATQRPARNLAEEHFYLELAGHYPDDPESQGLYRTAQEKWGSHLKLTGEPEPIDFSARTRQQVLQARELIHEDFAACVHLPWDSLTEIIGHGILPYQLWTAAAESGHGKTTFAMNVVKGLVDRGKRVYVVGLEQAAPVLRVYLAALALGFSTRYALANRWRELPPSAQGAIEDQLLEQENEAELLHFSDAPFLTVRTLPAVLTEAKQFGADLILIDHVHHVRVEGNNSAGEFTKLAQTLADFTKTEHVPILGMAQLNRGKGPVDRLKPYLPPALDHIQMGKILEQVSSVVLGLYRPLAGWVTATERSRIRLGEPAKDFLKPNTLSVAVLKSRVTGDIGDIVDLRYDRGHISDPAGNQP